MGLKASAVQETFRQIGLERQRVVEKARRFFKSPLAHTDRAQRGQSFRVSGSQMQSRLTGYAGLGDALLEQESHREMPMARSEVRILREGASTRGQALIGFLFAKQRRPQMAPGFGGIRLQRNRQSERRQGFRDAAFFQEGHPEFVESFRVHATPYGHLHQALAVHGFRGGFGLVSVHCELRSCCHRFSCVVYL